MNAIHWGFRLINFCTWSGADEWVGEEPAEKQKDTHVHNVHAISKPYMRFSCSFNSNSNFLCSLLLLRAVFNQRVQSNYAMNAIVIWNHINYMIIELNYVELNWTELSWVEMSCVLHIHCLLFLIFFNSCCCCCCCWYSSFFFLLNILSFFVGQITWNEWKHSVVIYIIKVIKLSGW